MAPQTIDDLLASDADDLTALATNLDADVRIDLLRSSAQVLSRSGMPFRQKLLGFIQALASPDEGELSGVPDVLARALITTAHADDPSDRLAALSALAVVTAHTRSLSVAIADAILATFEHARKDTSTEVRDFADEVLSTGNYVCRVLLTSSSQTSDEDVIAAS
jgi:hypothetical protein